VKWQTGASRIVEALQHGGVRCVFGLPGTQTLELFEALRQSGLRTVVATNELSAAFMAGGWARVTGDPGVLLTISGPGFTWALTGIAEARLDSVPLVHIAGSPPTDTAIERSFRQQELRQAAIAAPLVKSIIEADSYSDPGVAAGDALLLARSGEPGPILFQVSSTTLSANLNLPVLNVPSLPAIDGDELETVCLKLRSARRPVFMVGQGTVGYSGQLRAIVEHVQAPVITTPSARGVLPENHRLNFGFDPFAGSIRAVNEFVESCDLVLAIGCKLGHGGTSGFELELPKDRLVHFDASAEVIEANYPASLGVVGDAGALFQRILKSPPERSSWTDQELQTWRSRIWTRPSDATEPRIGGTRASDASSFFESLRRALPSDAVLVLDSGLHQILARRYYSVLAPSGLLMPTDLQSMGFAIPTAIGARIAKPYRSVVALVGDGGFAMTAMELLSAAREGLSLVVIVFADGAFGQIRLQQLASYGASHGVDLRNPDISLLAEAVGARYESVGDDDSDAETVIQSALQYSGVTIIEVPVRDSLAILTNAAVARTRETTRRAAGRGLFQFLRRAFRSRR
jgi:acetolactate synthase-1/2/3 large subunit